MTASGGSCEYLKLATGDQRPATGETLPSKSVATAIVRHVEVLSAQSKRNYSSSFVAKGKACKMPRKAKGAGLKTLPAAAGGHYKAGHCKTGQELRY